METDNKEQNEIKEEPKISIPEIPLEDYEIPVEKEDNIKDETNGSLKYAFIGAGQGGGRIAQAFYNLGYKKTIALNTASHDLKTLKLPEAQKFLAKPKDEKEGVGKNIVLANTVVSSYKEEIFDLMRKVFGNGVDHIMICAGLGGGTGGGSTGILKEVAQKYLEYLGVANAEKKVGAIVSLPTRGELTSPIVKANVTKAIEFLEGSLPSPTIFMDNSKIEKMYAGIPPAAFWPTINNSIAMLFDIFNRLSNIPSSYTSFDPADYSSVVESQGCSVLGITKIKKFDNEEDMTTAVKGNLFKTLLAEGFDFSSSKVAACIIVGDKKIMGETKGLMELINYGIDMITQMCPYATIHRGIYDAEGIGCLKIYTMIGGMGLLSKLKL